MSGAFATTRRAFALAAGAVGATALRFAAEAAEFEFKLGNDEPPSYPNSVRAEAACAKILEETNGRVSVKFYPNSQLGSDSAMLSQIRSGALEFQLLGDNIIASVAPGVDITSVPFAFPSHQAAWRAADGVLGAYVRRTIRRANLEVLDVEWDSGLRQIANSIRPVLKPEDLKGLRIRVPTAQLDLILFKALGAAPTPVPAQEAYVSLQTKLVDGIEVPLDAIEAYKYYEVLKYVSMTNHMWVGISFLVNPDAWKRLPSALQAIVARIFNAAGRLGRADVARSELDLVATLKGQGLTVATVDTKPFQRVLEVAGYYKQLKTSFPPEAWAALESAIGKLE